ncbi:hypothetical protein [Schleiferilactobacillus shenzhenensis]|uniref:hypothetical protein n=1 Tax=Schleiferilactobacillus shenzhenensis TaxID=1231337 RepID=UPI00058B8B8E|nr:hypothetical protein [Schleiferilactobacillus shenzhenensis]
MGTTVFEVPNHYHNYAFSKFMQRIENHLRIGVDNPDEQFALHYRTDMYIHTGLIASVKIVQSLTSVHWDLITRHGAYELPTVVYDPHVDKYHLRRYEIIKHMNASSRDKMLPIFELRQRFEAFEFRVMSIVEFGRKQQAIDSSKMIFVETFTKRRLTMAPPHRDYLTRQYLAYTIQAYWRIVTDPVWLTKNERVISFD